jgi:glycosyltransferase involved in cell wall biosynthesis
VNVLFASDHAYLPQRVGGTKSSTHDLCLSLRARGHRVAVVAALGGRDAIGVRHRIAERLGVPGPWTDRAVGYPVHRARRVDAAAVAAAAARERADIVVVQAERPSPVIDAARATGLPVLVYLRDVELRKMDRPPPDAPDVAYVANSAFTAGRWREAFGIDPVPVPPLIRPERYRCAPSGERVVFVNPVPEKGADTAFALAEARPDVPFLFVAGWPVPPEADRERRARAARLANVEWHPSVQDMRVVYRRARLLLAPSRWEEAWGRVASEAQVSGIPVLASRRGGLPEAVGPGGLVVDHDAPLSDWLAALSAAIDDPRRHAALSAAAAAHAARPEFAPDALVRQFEAVAGAHAARRPAPPAPTATARPGPAHAGGPAC